MSSWKGKTRGGVLGHKIFIFLLKNFDISVAYFVLRFVVFYFVFFSPKAFKSIFYLYNERLGFSFIKSFFYIYKNYYSLGQVLLDKVALLAGFYNKFTYDFEDEIYLKTMIEENTGGILISAHLGNWEFSSQLLNRLEGKFNIVIFDAEHERIKEQLSLVLVNKKLNVILIKDDLSHIYEINNALRNKEFICIHGDRYVANSKTISHNFLGEEANFPVGVFYLAAQYHVPVSFVYAIKSSNKHYKFFATPPKYFSGSNDKKNKNEKIKEVVNDYVENLEMMVKKYPEQWFNYFNFWSKS